MELNRPGEGLGLFDRPYLLLTLVSLFWAINIVLGRYVAGEIPPFMLGQLRWTGAALVLLPFALPHLRRDWRAILASLWLMLFLSLAGVTLYNSLAYYALQYTGAIDGSLFQSSGPLWVAVFSFLIFRERLTTGQTVGILTSLAGIVAIVTRGDPSAILRMNFNIGDLWFLFAVVIYALYTALLRRRPPIHPLSFLGFTIIAGAMLHLPAAAWEWALGYRMEVTTTSLAILAYIVIFPSLVAYLFFNRGVELIGANRASPFLYLIPIFGSSLAILFLGERPALYHLIGYTLIICGIVISQKGKRKNPTGPAT